ncbi:3'-5' exonuclease [Agromyces atrinae]|uniref:exonuclease domain-containing protein n=1 Tax=Agromyces atrinae TaxID=592376 RepID=UPI001F58C82D|nr:exonuclease domain-containing protein [Agromyces atrinae]MCI2958618.1 3'-5' exonuclease [Agromyces atrinae]
MDTTTLTWTDSLTVFDLETTGIDVETSRIVTAHVGVLDRDGVVVERRDWLIDPGVEIPAGAAAVHGISTEYAVAHGAPARESIADIIETLRSALVVGRPLVAYNAPYDLTLLNREARRHGLTPLDAPSPVIDPLVLDKALDRYRRGKRTLEVTAGHYGVVLEGAHDAGADAIAAGRVAQAIARAFPEVASLDGAAIHARQVEWSREQAESYQAWRRANGTPDFVTSGAWPER